MLVGGCGKDKETPAKEITDLDLTPTLPREKAADTNATKPVKELILEEKVVGEYEFKLYGNTGRVVLLKNGAAEAYTNGKKDEEEAKWSIIKEGELHVTTPYERGIVYRINKGSPESITYIAHIFKDGKRKDLPKEAQLTFKKIK